MNLCECGCGGTTKIADKTQARDGTIKGQPNRYIVGHHGKLVDNYFAIHKWLRRNCPKSGACVECGRKGFTEWALIHGREHARVRENYRELCRGCHRRYDLSQLDWDTVAVIQRKSADGATTRELAAEYGVDRHTIRTALAATVPGLAA